MSLKVRLRIAIVALVTLVVVGLSVLYLITFTNTSLTSASERGTLVARQVRGDLKDELSSKTRGLRLATPEEWKSALTEIVRTDPDITKMLQRSLGDADVVAAILVTDSQGRVLASSGPIPASAIHTFEDLKSRGWVANLRDLMTRREDYATTLPIGINSQEVLFKITVLIQAVFLKRDVAPTLEILGVYFGSALLIAAFLGSVLPTLVLSPLERVSRSIDLIRSGQFDTSILHLEGESREFAAVQSKLSLLGEQYRGARQDALELRSNIERLLQSLEEAVLLFDNTGKLILAGDAAERILGISHEQMAGRGIEELFPVSSALGNLIGRALQLRQSVLDQPTTISRNGASNVRLLASVEILEKPGEQEQVGTVVKLRDVESRRQLERQLDFSSRLAAISRLTGGVAHEIKNPLNAMALHLEVLRSKLDTEQPELDVIAREIRRLDTVVKTFLNFNRPVELQARPLNLAQIVEQVLALVSVDAQDKNIELETAIADKLWLNGDPDLLQQAILNVVNNGMEAMREGGKLSIRAEWAGDICQVIVRDNGHGIPAEIQDRVFNLYFTTKREGSGIGLATTFRVVQLHSGTIDFITEPGRGTTFRLRFPGIADYEGETYSSATVAS